MYALGSAPVFIKDGQASPTKEYLIADDDFLKVVNLPLLSGTALPRRRPPWSRRPRR